MELEFNCAMNHCDEIKPNSLLDCQRGVLFIHQDLIRPNLDEIRVLIWRWNRRHTPLIISK